MLHGQERLNTASDAGVLCDVIHAHNNCMPYASPHCLRGAILRGKSAARPSAMRRCCWYAGRTLLGGIDAFSQCNAACCCGR